MKTVFAMMMIFFSISALANQETCGRIKKLRPGNYLDPIYESADPKALMVLVGELNGGMRAIAHTDAEIAILQSAFLADSQVCGLPTDDKLIGGFYTKR